MNFVKLVLSSVASRWRLRARVGLILLIVRILKGELNLKLVSLPPRYQVLDCVSFWLLKLDVEPEVYDILCDQPDLRSVSRRMVVSII